MKTFFIIPFFLVLLFCNPNNPELMNIAANSLHTTTPRSENLPSPFAYGVETFYQVTGLARNDIRHSTNKKCGIYCWVNNKTGSCYVGKAEDLYLRLSNYYQKAYIKRTLSSSGIARSINKYGLESFSLVILEVTTPSKLSQAEQNWMDTLKPDLNWITKVLVPYDPTKVKPNRSGENNSFYGRSHTEANKQLLRQAALARLTPNRSGHEFVIEDVLLGTTTTYSSIRKGVEAMGWNQPNTMRFLRNNNTNVNKLYLKRYKLYVKQT